ncbi:MAG: xanthine dehydrogenase family protein molybdopterin-binding subunit [Rhizobiales bacterium]|nr:xanthine dehydrogenase family protein molybdopterin-binding subunit [Hyphomicrobiales bacterium]
MNAHVKLSRRALLKGGAATAGAFTLGFSIPFTEAQAQAATPEINAWVVIQPDDRIIVRIARSEMGQGTLTGLAQLVAEELEADWAKVGWEYPTPGENLKRNRVWRNFSTGGSRGIRESHQYVREGGAAARMMLVEAAARNWNVPVSECRAAKSIVTHAPSGRTASYGSLAAAAAKLEPPKDLKLKPSSEWTIVGKSVKRLDTVDKLNGKQVYGADIRLPGMLNAAIKACPVFGGKIASFDAAKITGMPGVKKVVQVNPHTVAVVADTWWQAKTALDALPIVWDEGPNARASSDTIAAMLREGLDAEQAFEGNKAGDAKGAIASAARKIEATYSYPFQNHACMEPMNATALWTAEKCEVWCPTQNGEAALAAAIEASGHPAARCDVHKVHLGGGFGRRGRSDYVTQAVLIAKQMPGIPIKLLWSREEDMLQGTYHPITMARMVGGLDKDGNLVGLHMRISGQSILAGVNPQALQNGRDPVVFQGLNPGGAEGPFGYGIPNLLIDHAMRNPHVPPGFWRGVNLNQNAIYVECFMDELAHAAGVDPLEFRRRLMKNAPKHLAVLEAVAKGIGWGAPSAPGTAKGLAQIMGFGSYVAAAAEVSVSNSGAIKVHRIVAATNPGHVVNPDQVAAQVEGSFVYGLSAAFHQECTVKGGRIVEENFDSYPAMRIDEMPKVESILVPSGDFWGGVGEPTIAVAAPAVMNAIFAATGKRVRSLPLKNADLRRA